MRDGRQRLTSLGLLERVHSAIRRVSSPWINRYHRASMPWELQEKVRAYVLSVNETLEQHPPSRDELNCTIGRAVEQAGSVERLLKLASSGCLAEVTEIRPFKLEMDLLNKCNLRCPMCMMSHQSHYKQPLQRMSLEVFERLAAEVFWHVHSLSFTFGAEPLLHPEFSRFVEIASRYR